MSAFSRRVDPEILDDLDPTDPLAIGSRRDLRRLNVIMRNAGSVARGLSRGAHTRLMELGAGDGWSTLQVVRRLPEANGASVTLLDRQPAADPANLAGLAAHGYAPELLTADVFDGLDDVDDRFDAIWANLFLHHFQEMDLARLLRIVASRTDRFIACEPRRSRLALETCRLLPLIGCNEVTRHDGRVSVVAGFRDHELSAFWPDPKGWMLTERPIPPFGHFFMAERR